MLPEHYKLAMQPFGVTPDPRFLYLSATHREAMACLLHGIRSGRGFTALIAAPGMGKTTLLFNLLQMLKGDVKTAFLFQTLCGQEEFLNALLADLGIEDDGKSITRMHSKLNEYLLQESHNGRQVVVIIDEAQNLDEQVLEVVRMLSNFETANRKLLHVVLSGQPQLAEKLSSESLTQLRQRVSILARLAPLNPNEARDYIEHRLKLAGYTGDKPLFTNQAYSMIAEYSHGIPRNINNLCFNAMSVGCALKRPNVDALMVQEVINDLNLKTIVAPAKVSDEQSSQPSYLIERMFSSAKWRPEVLLAIAILASVVWLITQVVAPPRERFRPKNSVETLQPETKHNIKMCAPSRVLVTEAIRQRATWPAFVGAAEIPRTRTPWDESGTLAEESGLTDKLMRRADQIQSEAEHNIVPLKSAAERVTP